LIKELTELNLYKKMLVIITLMMIKRVWVCSIYAKLHLVH